MIRLEFEPRQPLTETVNHYQYSSCGQQSIYADVYKGLEGNIKSVYLLRVELRVEFSLSVLFGVFQKFLHEHKLLL